MRRHLREYPRGRVICREPRAGCANAKANAAGLARPVQTPKQMPRDSRRLRKRQSKCRETRAGPRKRQGKCRGTRAGCANAKANAARLARAAQMPRQTPRDSRRLRGQTRINPAPRAARGGGAARRPYGCFRARCGRARAAAGCRGRKNAGRGCRTCRPARRP